MTVTVEAMARTWIQREGERRAHADARAKRLAARLSQSAHLLREKHGATMVTLFGSLATGAYNDQSDVDLAVEGLASERYFSALADLMALFRGPVDLVRWEEAPTSLKARVTAEGRRL